MTAMLRDLIKVGALRRIRGMLTVDQIREKYLRYFEARGHAIVPSASLLPENDPTTLFTGSGMQPMLPYLLGQAHPLGRRITDSQKSLRVADIDEVGDNRHTTFFEMLGNWSLGDYFKREQIGWMFEFLTKELGLDARRLYVTAYAGNKALGIGRDEESAKLWQEQFEAAGLEAAIVENAPTLGMQNGRIFYYDERKNWWSRAGVPQNMPTGEPGGPDTEMFWDFGEALGFHEDSPYADSACHVNCDCGRFVEIGNNVFMEYMKTPDGFASLPQKNVDFGGGLERLAAASTNNPDVFMIDVFDRVRAYMEEASGQVYGRDEQSTRAMRIVMDHMRAAVFMVADGAAPSNKDQGYFTRRLLRRAMRFLDKLKAQNISIVTCAEHFFDAYQAAYPELQAARAVVLGEITKEEAKFRALLTAGLKKFASYTASHKAGEEVPVTQVFDLYQSFGFPFELSLEMAQEKGLLVNAEAYGKLLESHQALSRKGAGQKFRGGLLDHSEMSVKYHTATHLLHQALRTVLGAQAMQKGSNITPERLRFDFSHADKLTPDQIAHVEKIVNEQITRDLPVTREEMTVDEAKERGALGLFGHKYGERVSVYTVGDFSCEICGGPHVERTGGLGTFRITREESAGAGIRRIKAKLK